MPELIESDYDNLFFDSNKLSKLLLLFYRSVLKIEVSKELN